MKCVLGLHAIGLNKAEYDGAMWMDLLVSLGPTISMAYIQVATGFKYYIE